jgi:glycosyltransferase involved in cell wall biosynthesis
MEMLQRNTTVDISAIVPVGERHSPIAELHAEYRRGIERIGATAEFIYVIDGPRPDVAADLEVLRRSGERITVLQLSRAFGESTALMAGFEYTSGAIVLTLPAYFQIEGDEIPRLVAALDSADVIVGQRRPRAGGAFEIARRAAFHGLVNWMTRLNLHDLGCSARAMKRRVLEEISLYGDQHRLLPALADRQGFKVVEIDVRQSPKDRYEGGYRTREYLHRLLDVFAVFFLVRFTKKPLRFFGMAGATMLVIGTLLVTYLVVARLVFQQGLADRPALILSSLLVVLGLQLVALGLLGELMIFTHARGMKDYQVDRVIEFPSDEQRS